MNGTLQTENFRREMPPPLAPRPLNLPEPYEKTLANGLGVVLIEDKRLPLISFRLAFRSGDANDPADLPGLTDMLSHLLSEGTETRTSRQIAEEIERLGGTLSVGSASDFTTIAASSLSIYVDEILELIADGLSNREIAERLFLSENTVKTHSSRLFDKLSAKRRTQAVQLGKAFGLIP